MTNMLKKCGMWKKPETLRSAPNRGISEENIIPRAIKKRLLGRDFEVEKR